MKYIIAGTYQQYINYLRDNKLIKNETQYISSIENLYGLRYIPQIDEIIYCGTFYMRADIDMIQQEIESVMIRQ